MKRERNYRPHSSLKDSVASMRQDIGRVVLYEKTDIDIEINNQGDRLIAHAIIYYRAVILSE